MAAPSSFDVLVIGSGASGLAAAVSAERAGARVAVAAKGSLQSCNSAKAQGGIQAAFGDDDSPEQHADDVWKSSTRRPTGSSSEVLTSEAPVGDPLARGARRRVHPGERRLPPGALRRRVAQAPAAGRRPHRATRSRRRCARRSRPAPRTAFAKSPLRSLERRENGWRARVRRARDRRGDGRPRRRRPLLPRGAGARRAVDEPSRRDGRGDADRARARRGGARPRRAPVPPERRRVAAERCRATRSRRRRARTAPCC